MLSPSDEQIREANASATTQNISYIIPEPRVIDVKPINITFIHDELDGESFDLYDQADAPDGVRYVGSHRRPRDPLLFKLFIALGGLLMTLALAGIGAATATAFLID